MPSITSSEARQFAAAALTAAARARDAAGRNRIADECLDKIAAIYAPWEPAARPLTELVRLAANGCPTPSSATDVKLRGLTYISTYPSLDDERLARHAIVHMGTSFADSPAMNDAEATTVSKRMFQAFDAYSRPSPAELSLSSFAQFTSAVTTHSRTLQKEALTALETGKAPTDGAFAWYPWYACTRAVAERPAPADPPDPVAGLLSQHLERLVDEFETRDKEIRVVKQERDEQDRLESRLLTVNQFTAAGIIGALIIGGMSLFDGAYLAAAACVPLVAGLGLILQKVDARISGHASALRDLEQKLETLKAGAQTVAPRVLEEIGSYYAGSSVTDALRKAAQPPAQGESIVRDEHVVKLGRVTVPVRPG